MGDVRLETVKERKLGEITLYASMIRLDICRRNEYFDLMTMINRDVDLIDSLLNDVALPETAPIKNPLYVSRLSESEIEDEKFLDSLRGISEEVSEEPVAEEAAKVTEEMPAVIEDVPASIPEEESEAVGVAAENIPAEEEECEPVQPAFSGENIAALKKIREMKCSKIDLFIEREFAGDFREEVCEDIIRFTKIDIKLIDLFLKLDLADEGVLKSDLKVIVDIISEMDPPKYGKVYTNSLNKEEKKLEQRYNDILDRLDNLVEYKFPELVPKE